MSARPRGSEELGVTHGSSPIENPAGNGQLLPQNGALSTFLVLNGASVPESARQNGKSMALEFQQNLDSNPDSAFESLGGS